MIIVDATIVSALVFAALLVTRGRAGDLIGRLGPSFLIPVVPHGDVPVGAREAAHAYD